MNEIGFKPLFPEGFAGVGGMGAKGALQKTAQNPLTDFKELVSRSVDELAQTQAESNRSVEEMAMGRKDIHQTMISMEMAGLSMRVMLQFRNKMISAYEEIMRMQF
jgi:flagellar hook-basal body complex protein FliE